MESQPVFHFNRLEAPYLDDPYPLYAQARRELPVFYSPIFDVWFLTRYHDIRLALGDPARFSSAYLIRTPYGAPPEVMAELDQGYPETHMLINQDPPDHTVTRGRVAKAFLPQRISALAPRIQVIADQLIDRIAAAGAADLVAELANPLPLAVLGELAGLPGADLGRIKTWTEELMVLVTPSHSLERQVGSARSSVAFQRYLEQRIDERIKAPGDDLLSTVIVPRYPGDREISRADLISLLIALLFAGHETTTNLIANTLLVLLRRPDLLEALRADPALVMPLIEEALRFDAPVQGMYRVTTTDVTVGTTRIPAGARVFLLFGSANRDPDVFADPDRFDIERANKDMHLSFGRGIHFCIGATLARLEARIALTTLAQRLPNLRLDRSQPIPYLPNLIHRSPRRIHTLWDGAA